MLLDIENVKQFLQKLAPTLIRGKENYLTRFWIRENSFWRDKTNSALEEKNPKTVLTIFIKKTLCIIFQVSTRKAPNFGKIPFDKFKQFFNVNRSYLEFLSMLLDIGE